MCLLHKPNQENEKRKVLMHVYNYCSVCDKSYPSIINQFCGDCGNKLEEKKRVRNFCVCDKELDYYNSDKFCIYCGRDNPFYYITRQQKQEDVQKSVNDIMSEAREESFVYFVFDLANKATDIIDTIFTPPYKLIRGLFYKKR